MTSVSENLYSEFVQNMTPFAAEQGLSIDTLLGRLEYRGSYSRERNPELFPARCVCGEELTAHAYQFDDPLSNACSSYTIGSVCAGNLEREVKRLNCVTKLGKYLSRPRARLFEPLLTDNLLNEMNSCDLYTAKVISQGVWDRIDFLLAELRYPYEKDTAFAEGVCVAYGRVPEKVMLTYFLPDGSLW